MMLLWYFVSRMRIGWSAVIKLKIISLIRFVTSSNGKIFKKIGIFLLTLWEMINLSLVPEIWKSKKHYMIQNLAGFEMWNSPKNSEVLYFVKNITSLSFVTTRCLQTIKELLFFCFWLILYNLSALSGRLRGS